MWGGGVRLVVVVVVVVVQYNTCERLPSVLRFWTLHLAVMFPWGVHVLIEVEESTSTWLGFGCATSAVQKAAGLAMLRHQVTAYTRYTVLYYTLDVPAPRPLPGSRIILHIYHPKNP